jgi:hypothetical protein
MTLDALALQHRTDKGSSGHNYCEIYERYLEHLRDVNIKLLELGVGGYQYKDRGGESLRMWHDYFSQARIVAVDVYDKNDLGLDRVEVYKGSQDDPKFLTKLIQDIGQPDVIVDDASHVCKLTIASFEILFPLLKAGGLYICEDIHTSFWLQDYGGDPDPKGKGTTIQFFQELTAQLSFDTLVEEYRRPAYAGQIEFIHFYRNLVIVKKR